MSDKPIVRGGIMSGPIDLDGADARRRPRPPARVPATPGLVVTQRGSGLRGAVVSLGHGTVVIRDHEGRDRTLKLIDGGFDVDGRQATLVLPVTSAATKVTNSGSVAVPNARARVARASRILVEGVHDAELVEHVWGDDLRVEGIVVQPMHGADDLVEIVRSFGPSPRRRLGILLDHLVAGSKESRLAAGVDHPDVLITGHPYVDVWAAVKPSAVGIAAWPDVPKGQPWKEGVCAALGVADPPQFWKRVLRSVTSYADLEPAMVGSVEQLIDFVTLDS